MKAISQPCEGRGEAVQTVTITVETAKLQLQTVLLSNLAMVLPISLGASVPSELLDSRTTSQRTRPGNYLIQSDSTQPVCIEQEM